MNKRKRPSSSSLKDGTGYDVGKLPAKRMKSGDSNKPKPPKASKRYSVVQSACSGMRYLFWTGGRARILSGVTSVQCVTRGS